MINKIKRILESEKNRLLAIFFVALVVRIAYVSTLENRWYFYDTVHYDKAALSLLAGEGFGRGYYFTSIKEFQDEYSLPPVYPVFLAGIYAVFGRNFLTVRIIQSLLGALLCLIVYFIAKKIFNWRVGIIAAVITAFYPMFIFISGLLYSTMLFTVFIASFVWFALRSMESEKILFPVLAGLFLGLATLTGPILLGVFPLIALWILFIWRTNLLKKFYFTVVLLLTAIFTLIPWSIRNYKIFGKITPVSASVDWFLAEAESRVQRQIMVKIRSDAEGQHFDVYVNGEYDGTLSDTTSLQLVDKDYYFALMLKGGLSKYIDRCEFMFKNSDSPYDKRIIDKFEDESLTKNWLADSVFTIIDGQLTTTSPDVNRNYLAIFKAMASPQTVILHWGKDTEAAGVSQTGLVFLIGRPSFQENGYMIRREPYGLLQLWRVQNGKPVQLLDSKQGLKGLASAADGRIKERSLFGKIFHILTDDPQNFFEHYFSEFLHFWQLYPDRVMTKNKFTNRKNVVVSILSFGPVLLLSILGIILSFSNWRYTSLLFIMIIAFALGYSFFQTRIRYRIPVEPFMIIFASYSIWLLFEKFKRIRS